MTLGQRYDYLVGGLWWFNDALTFAFTLFASAAGVGVLLGRPFVVQRLSAIGVVLPLVFIALNLVRYLWALRASTGAGLGLAFGALRVNLSLSWVIVLACARGLIAERGVFLRTPKFRGSPRVRDLRLVAVETALGLGCLALAGAVLGVAGSPSVALIVAGLLGWSVLIYGSATVFALTDPERAPLSVTLRHKARLELAPRVSRAARSRRGRGGLAVAGSLALLLLIGVGVVSEADRAPVPEVGSIDEALVGPIDRRQPQASEPTASPAPGVTSSPPASQPAGTASPEPTIAPAATPAPTAAAIPTPTPTPAPQPTPPLPVPTPPVRP